MLPENMSDQPGVMAISWTAAVSACATMLAARLRRQR